MRTADLRGVAVNSAAARRGSATRSRGSGLPGRRWLTPWLFLAPALIVLGLMLWGPLANTAVLAFTDAEALGGGEFTGLDNFVQLAEDPEFHRALLNTVAYVVGVVPALVVLPLLLAVLVHTRLPGAGLFRAIFYSPVVASMVVVGLIWGWLLQSDGLVNAVLTRLRVVAEPIPFLTDSTLVLISAMMVTIWKGLGYYMVIYLAALTNVPTDLYEAAKVDGAGAVRRFLSVTVPCVRPSMVLIGALSTISAVKVFAEVFVLTNGTAGPGGQAKSLVYYIRQVGLGVDGEVGYASAMSLVLFLGTVGFALFAIWARGDAKGETR